MNDQNGKLRVGIIGCGAIHHHHADAITADSRLELAGFADTDIARAEESAKIYGGRAYADYLEMIDAERLDAVHICTPHYLHEPMAVEAMKRGCDVFCEKPMAISVAGAQHMADVAKETGRRLGICFQNRFRETSQLILRKLRSGELGRVLGAKASMTWNRGVEYYRSGAWRGLWATEGGGVLINQSIHTLDLLDQFCGGFEAVSAHVDRFLLREPYEVEDTATANFMLRSGGNALFFATNCYVKSTPPEISVVCENATLTLADELTIEYANGRRDVLRDPPIELSGKAVWGSCHPVAISRFYDSVLGGEEFLIGPDEGIRSIRLIDGIYRSSEQGGYVSL